MKARTKKKRPNGFTTMELAIVLMVFGMIVTTVMFAFQSYNSQRVAGETEDAISTVRLALMEYKRNHGVYPCPADPTLQPGNAMYGREARGVAWAAAPSPTTYLSSPCAINPNTPEVPGMDSNRNATTADDVVIIGAVPFATLLNPDNNAATTDDGLQEVKLSERLSMDGWNHKLKYAVSKNLTTIGGANNDFRGAIDMRDENGLSVLDVEDLSGDGLIQAGEDVNGNGVLEGRYAHAVLVSHGENGRGAFAQDGTPVPPGCAGGLPVAIAPEVASPMSEIDNCRDADGVFLSGLRSEKPHSYNDDTVRGVFEQNSSLWIRQNNQQVNNANPGNVGIGTRQPAQKLHVNGDIRVSKTSAIQYQDTTGSRALSAQALGGNGTATPQTAQMQCPANQVVTSIEQGRVNCAPAYNAAAVANQSCGALYLQGVRSDGTLICCNPTIPVGNAGGCN